MDRCIVNRCSRVGLRWRAVGRFVSLFAHECAVLEGVLPKRAAFVLEAQSSDHFSMPCDVRLRFGVLSARLCAFYGVMEAH